MNGKRIPGDVEPHLLGDGEYGYWQAGGGFYARPPGFDGIANRTKHRVEEHADGSITVSPSILVGKNAGAAGEWHGYLERGVWRVV